MTTKETILTGEFWRAAALRAVRTFAQTLLVLVAGDGANIITGSVADWAITSAGAAVLSILTSIVAGIPEVPSAPTPSSIDTDTGSTDS